MSGKLISIEGIDGSGKTTILKRIKKRWEEERSIENVIFTAEPTDFVIGKKARELLHTDIDPLSLAFLFLSDHADHLSKLINPALAEGKNVITDRYIDSRYAYQGVMLKKYFYYQKSKIFEDEKYPIKWLKRIHEPFSVVPDRTILFVTDVDVAIERISKNGRKRIKLEDKNFLDKVQGNYLSLAKEEKERIIKIDANMGMDFVEMAVERELNKILS